MDQRPLPELAVFAQVAQHRSFRAAAQVLGVSASALSHSLRNLETRLDVRLLHRTTRSVAPTEAGERLLARLGPALADIDAALSEVAAFRDRPAGRLRINIARSAARWLLAPRLGGFLNAYPQVRAEIVCEDGLTDIVAGGFDCGVRLGESLQADMIATPIGGELSQALVASPDYVAACGAPRRPEDVLDHRCLLFRRGGGQPWPWEFEREGREVVVDPPGVLLSDENEVIRRACLDGAGLAFLMRDLVTPDIQAGRLVSLLDEWCEPFPGFFLYYPSRRQLSPALRAFIDWMRR
ncbi:MAG: LysR family transcriptional regulator [Caulobacter sp.]|nr:LysR family transcriptional regulator [Caulobacter sp.]